MEEILKDALKKCANNFNPSDSTAWAEKRSYDHMAEDMARELRSKNCRLVEYYTLQEEGYDPHLVSSQFIH